MLTLKMNFVIVNQSVMGKYGMEIWNMEVFRNP